MKTRILLVVIASLLILKSQVYSQSFDFSGQVSGLHLAKIEKPWNSFTGLRYIPELQLKIPVNKEWNFEMEASANAYAQLGVQMPDSVNAGINLKPYRVWGKFASERFELRAGLQKISFGSATMLRPLMWFDHMDPRDPLQLTDGVYALLGRYFFQNNANLWIWGIWPGKTVKGWEFIVSNPRLPEFGGRFQMPAGKGEIALSGHFRSINPDQSAVYGGINTDKPVPEYRLGLDGKWDIGPGIWFEGTYTYADIRLPDLRHVKMLTLGTDYTFGLGNGLTIMGEQLFYQTSNSIFRRGYEMDFSALSLTYQISLTHSISAMVFYRWDHPSWYRFINWTINLNKISLHLIAFWNPDLFDIYRNTGNSNLMGGKGVQLLFVWNH